MNVLDMVRSFLEGQGFDGLANPDADCACLLEDLAPCGELNGDECVAGYRVACQCGEHDFRIVQAASRAEARPSGCACDDAGEEGC